MSTLQTYTFPASTKLANAIVRCYACGRYLNNTGSAITPTIRTTLNGTTQCSISPSIQSNPVALGWRLWAHFYVSNISTQNGVIPSLGSNIEITFTQAQATSTVTGTFTGAQYLQLAMNPYNTPISPSLQQTLAVLFTPVGGDALEVHAAYMEVL